MRNLGGRSSIVQSVSPRFLASPRGAAPGGVSINGYLNGDLLVSGIADGFQGGRHAGLVLTRFGSDDLRVDDFEYGPTSGSFDIQTETFNKANGALGPNLSWDDFDGGFPGLVVLGNECTIASGNTGGAVATDDTSSGHMYVEATISTLSVSTFWVVYLYGAVSSTDAATGYYFNVVADASGDGLTISLFDNEANAVIAEHASPETVNVAEGDVLRLEID